MNQTINKSETSNESKEKYSINLNHSNCGHLWLIFTDICHV